MSCVRRTALALGVVPTTLHGREFFKRVFYGPLSALGPEIGETDADAALLEPVAMTGAVANYKVLFAVGQLEGSTSQETV